MRHPQLSGCAKQAAACLAFASVREGPTCVYSLKSGKARGPRKAGTDPGLPSFHQNPDFIQSGNVPVDI